MARKQPASPQIQVALSAQLVTFIEFVLAVYVTNHIIQNPLRDRPAYEYFKDSADYADRYSLTCFILLDILLILQFLGGFFICAAASDAEVVEVDVDLGRPRTFVFSGEGVTKGRKAMKKVFLLHLLQFVLLLISFGEGREGTRGFAVFDLFALVIFKMMASCCFSFECCNQATTSVV